MQLVIRSTPYRRSRGRAATSRALAFAFPILACFLLLAPEAMGAPIQKEVWVARYSGTENNGRFAAAIAVDRTGDVFVTGQASVTLFDIDFVTVKYDHVTGAQLWVASYAGPNRDSRAAAIAVDNSGNVLVTGRSKGTGTGIDYATVKYDGRTGQELWASRYNGPANSDDIASAIAVDCVGNVYVTGKSDGGRTDDDFATVKYDGATGAQLWVARYNGPGSGLDDATGIATDAAGNVFVTGESYGGSAASNDFATIKYDGTTGAELWVARYNGPASLRDSPNAIVVDGAGNVFVTGGSDGGKTDGFPNGYQYATVKYDGATGAQIWVARYAAADGSPHTAARAIALDSAGNVFVTGSAGGFQGTNYRRSATLKYDGSTGAQLWLVLFHGPAGLSDYVGTAIAVDAAGNAYVTGTSNGGKTSGHDYVTLKYNGATGAQLWLGRYNGPINYEDNATAIALGPDGVYVTGYSPGNAGADYATVKYPGAPCPRRFAIGDVFVGIHGAFGAGLEYVGGIQWRSPHGVFYDLVDAGFVGIVTGMSFDSAGTLYVTDFSEVRRYDNTGVLLGDFGSGYNAHPESILFDAAGNAYVGQADGSKAVMKFDPAGNFLASYTVATEDRGSDWIDLASDQMTLFYTSEGDTIKRFNLATNTQLPDFAVLPAQVSAYPWLDAVAYALRLLPTGGLLVADSNQIYRLDASGHIVQTYRVAGEKYWFDLNLDPDGTSFWGQSSDTSNIYKFDIASGAVLLRFNSGTPGIPATIEGTVGGVVVNSVEVTADCPSLEPLIKPAGAGCQNAPIARCQNVTVPTDPGRCDAMVTASQVDNGSSDPDTGDSISLTLSPAGPYLVGTTNVTLTVTDSHGASDSCMATITVVDKERPSISCPKDIQVSNDPGMCSAKLDPGMASAADNCSGVSIGGVRSDSMALTDPYPVGSTTITWTAMDASANAASCSQTITVLDKEAPVITCPADKTVDQVSAYGAAVSYSVDASDNCSGVKVVCTPPSGSVFPLGTTTVNCTATDAAGNSSSCSFKVTVKPPASSAPGAKVTGGGGITVSSGTASFSFVAQVQAPGPLQGNLTYADDKAGVTIQMTSLTSLVVSGTHGRFFGKCTVNGAGSFDFMVDVDDLGEPGVGVDKFSIQVSNGYNAAGTLVNGNIQVHKP